MRDILEDINRTQEGAYKPPMEDRQDQRMFELLQELWDEYHKLVEDFHEKGEMALVDTPKMEKLRGKLKEVGINLWCGCGENEPQTSLEIK